ncbi:lipoprotein-releasing ABC transporter permease subunit [Pelagibacteraceae bacterium]|nr:lipoprotein-releasing ABC transporter permease subunit [Pelagibacteraceae bacterium]MDC0366487.1 lipoprotein-releasing ABC transporter permease subunit [Pelagibacteraceae bacterium]
MFTKIERLISFRNLRPKKKEGFLKVISIFSFLGIMLGVAILIVVMSVMNGFKTDLTKKILGLNPHIVIQPNNFKIEDSFIVNLEKTIKNIDISKTYSGEGIVVSRDNAKGIIIKGVDIKNKKTLNFFEQNISSGSIDNFKRNTAFIGTELSFNLNLKVGDKINLMSSAFVATPFGGLPKQETLTIAGVFNTGFFEFDQNFVFLNLSDALSIFDKEMYEQNLEIYLSDPMKADGLKKVIQKQNENYYIYSWTDLNKSFFSALKVERNVMFIILTLILIVAAFNIISGLTILIKNKTKEIAILKTLGLSNSSIKKLFFLTGFTIGFFATFTGALLGVIFALNIEKLRMILSNFFNFEIFPSDVYFLEQLPSQIDIDSIIMICSFSLIVSALASYLPAMNISKMKTFQALKYE